MADPIRQVRALPWSFIAPITGATIALTAATELLLMALAARSPSLSGLSELLAYPFFATLAQVAHKALARNLSDVAGMAAPPSAVRSSANRAGGLR